MGGYMLTFPQLKQAIDNTMSAYGITEDQAKLRLFGLDDTTLLAVAAGDMSALGTESSTGEGITAAGDKINDLEKITEPVKNSRGKKTSTTSKDQHTGATSPVKDTSDILETVQGEIVGESYNNELLPPSIMTDIENKLSEFSSRYNIDLEKCSNLQWRSACMYVGRYLQASGIFLDREKLKRGGSKYYKAETIAAMLPIWEYLTGLYKHIPLTCDFISFVGVSNEWFYDTRNVLTSSRVEIAKKARAIEESALSAALTDHKENPTGRIYYTKARLGWQETTTIQHVSATATAPAVALPVFDNSITSLPDNT